MPVHSTVEHTEGDLLEGLEPDQLVAAAARPLPRYPLSRRGATLLWLLRIFALLVTAAVVYTFIEGL